MSKANQIKDPATRQAVQELERTNEKLKRIPQLPDTANLKTVIDTINKITDSLKRK